MAPVATGLLAPVATGLLAFGKIGNENVLRFFAVVGWDSGSQTPIFCLASNTLLRNRVGEMQTFHTETLFKCSCFYTKW